jgi:hypothetical protein
LNILKEVEEEARTEVEVVAEAIKAVTITLEVITTIIVVATSLEEGIIGVAEIMIILKALTEILIVTDLEVEIIITLEVVAKAINPEEATREIMREASTEEDLTLTTVVEVATVEEATTCPGARTLRLLEMPLMNISLLLLEEVIEETIVATAEAMNNVEVGATTKAKEEVTIKAIKTIIERIKIIEAKKLLVLRAQGGSITQTSQCQLNKPQIELT